MKTHNVFHYLIEFDHSAVFFVFNFKSVNESKSGTIKSYGE
jgi:hypothetical protein